MGKTQNFGLNTFSSEGRLADEGYKFSDRDRHLIDSLFATLFNHDHQSVSSAQIASPGQQNPPTLTVSTSGGSLGAGRTFFYKYSYMDADGNESAASVAGAVNTPDLIIPPGAMALATATTGGTLVGGTYKYALSYTQASGETTAPNTNSIIVGSSGTSTVTITLDTLPDGATGWKVYRRAPGDDDYYLLASVASGNTEYIDTGAVSPDCTKKRPTRNTTNSSNKITIALPAGELPLDSRITAWRIYRTSVAGSYGNQSLVATVTDTTTEGGSDLVTSYEDVGGTLGSGVPLQQTAIPPSVPGLDAARAFTSSGRLPSSLAPLGVSHHSTFLPGVLTAQTYNQFYIPHDMLVERLEAFFLTGPTGVNSTNYVTIRIRDNSLVDEVQSIWNDAATQNEVVYISNNATGGTFTLSNGVNTTVAIAYNATAATIETRLETDIVAINDVTVVGSGTIADPWIITYVDPGGTNVTELTANDASLTGGTTTIFTSIEGSDGGTFTLSDGVDTTAAIAYNAAAATLETRLQTDITSITDVTVTGTGTSLDPWVVTFVNPGDQDIDLLIANDTNLNGTTTVVETIRGRGNTVIDLVCNQVQQSFFWQSSTTDYGEIEAESATGGVTVSDTLAGNDSAAELDTQLETCSWNIGVLEPGDYVFRFYVSDTSLTASFAIDVTDLNGPTSLASSSHSPARKSYTPAYELSVTLDGTENIEVSVEKTDTGSDSVRVDRFEYEVELPTLYGGQTATVEVLVTGTPTTNGENVNFGVWF